MVFTQTSYHFLRYQKDKNRYVPKENLLKIGSDTLKKHHIYLDPTGKYFFDNKFIDSLLNKDERLISFLQDVRFVKQEILINTGTKQFSAFMLNSERLLKSSIAVGINHDNTKQLCYKPDVFKMLFDLKDLSIYDVLSLASRFSCECNGYDITSFDINELDKNQKISYYNAYRAFLRESFSILKPIKVSAKLSFWNFFHYTIMTNITMNSSDVESRSSNYPVVFFALITYFLLALQATILGRGYEKMINT